VACSVSFSPFDYFIVSMIGVFEIDASIVLDKRDIFVIFY